jgi:hypothetical protein
MTEGLSFDVYRCAAPVIAFPGPNANPPRDDDVFTLFDRPFNVSGESSKCGNGVPVRIRVNPGLAGPIVTTLAGCQSKRTDRHPSAGHNAPGFGGDNTGNCDGVTHDVFPFVSVAA